MNSLHKSNPQAAIQAYVLVHGAPERLGTIYIQRETDHFVYYAGGNYERKQSASKTISSDLAEIQRLQAEHISRMANVRAYELKRARGTHLFELLLDAATDSINQDKRPEWLEEALDLLEGVANQEELQRVRTVRAASGLDHSPNQPNQEAFKCAISDPSPLLSQQPQQPLVSLRRPSAYPRAAVQ